MIIYHKLEASVYSISSVHLIMTFVALQTYSIFYQIHLLLQLYKIACYQPGNSNVESFSLIKKYPLKNFEYCSQKITVRKGDKEKQIAAERDIIGMLMSTSYKTKEAVNLEASLVYPTCQSSPCTLCTKWSTKKMRQTITWKENTAYILPRCNSTNAGVVLKKWNSKRFCMENIKEYTSTIQHYIFCL